MKRGHAHMKLLLRKNEVCTRGASVEVRMEKRKHLFIRHWRISSRSDFIHGCGFHPSQDGFHFLRGPSTLRPQRKRKRALAVKQFCQGKIMKRGHAHMKLLLRKNEVCTRGASVEIRRKKGSKKNNPVNCFSPATSWKTWCYAGEPAEATVIPSCLRGTTIARPHCNRRRAFAVKLFWQSQNSEV